MAEITLEDFKLVFIALWKNKLPIILITLGGLFAGLFYTSFQTRQYIYEATATVCVTYSTYQEQLSGSSVMSNYSGIVVSSRVSEHAAVLLKDINLTPQSIQSMVSVKINPNSYVMGIAAKNPSPERAIRVANAVAEAFVSQVSNLSGTTSIQILDFSNTANIVSVDGVTQLRILAAMGAALAACGWIAVRELFSRTVRSIPQCVDDENEILAIIPYVDKSGVSG